MTKHKKKEKLSGYIYILSNASFTPGLVKIGETQSIVDKRISELSRSTSVPTPFKKEFIRYVKNRKLAELTIHHILVNHRTNNKREFFQINIEDAIHIVKNVCDCVDHDMQCAA